MAEILEFSTREAQACNFFKKQLDQLLRQRRADDRLIDHAVASLTHVYSELQSDSACHFEVQLPDLISGPEAETLHEDIAACIERLRREHHDLTLKLAA